jgi:hypothetical protein
MKTMRFGRLLAVVAATTLNVGCLVDIEEVLSRSKRRTAIRCSSG